MDFAVFHHLFGTKKVKIFTKITLNPKNILYYRYGTDSNKQITELEKRSRQKTFDTERRQAVR